MARRQPASVRLARIETVLFLREPVALFFSLAFPLILLLFIGAVVGAEEVEEGVRGIDMFFPTIIAITAANIGIMGLAIHIAENRSRGVLRRFRLSPIRDRDYFLAQMITTLLVLALATALLAAITLSVYGPPPDVNYLAAAGASLVTAYVAFSIGVTLGGLPLPVRSVQVLGATVFFLLFFSSGMAIPRQAFPEWLFQLSAANPLVHLNDFIFHAYIGRAPSSWVALGSTVGLGVVMNLVAWKTFDWEGRT